MRISDWSSDVCSSDLKRVFLKRAGEAGERAYELTADFPVLPGDTLRLDRKSVVSGKSVSVRVDLGGRRSITKHIQSDTKHLLSTLSQPSVYNIKNLEIMIQLRPL